MDWSNAPSHLGWKYLPDPEGRTNTYLVKRSEHAEPEVFTHGPFGLAAMIAEIQNPPPPSPEQIKAKLRAYAATLRWRKEIGGTSVAGLSIQTDATSQSKIAQAIQSIDLGIVAEPLPWKTGSGFVSLTRDELVVFAQAVAAHVQSCFTTEETVTALIDAGTITTTAEIDAAFAA